MSSTNQTTHALLLFAKLYFSVSAARTLDPELAKILYEFALCLENERKLNEALEVYRLGFNLDSSNASICVNIGRILYVQERIHAAKYWARRATKLEPRNALAWFNLGNAFDELGNLDRAIEAYQRVIEIDEKYADAHYNLGLSLWKTKQYLKSLPHWTKCAELYKNGPYHEAAQENIATITKNYKLAGVIPESSSLGIRPKSVGTSGKVITMPSRLERPSVP